MLANAMFGMVKYGQCHARIPGYTSTVAWPNNQSVLKPSLALARENACQIIVGISVGKAIRLTCCRG